MSDERDRGNSLREPDILDEIAAEVAADLEEDQAPEGGPAYQVIGALVALVVGVLGAWRSLVYGLDSLSDPGPGLWPFVICVAMIVFAVILLVVGSRLHDTEKFTRSSVLPAVGVLTFVVLAWLLPDIGFELPSLLMCLVWTRFLGGESWRSSILVSFGTVIAFHVLFVEVLGVPLPRLF
jgi:putative tricarboxylic transport membrane protein